MGVRMTSKYSAILPWNIRISGWVRFIRTTRDGPRRHGIFDSVKFFVNGFGFFHSNAQKSRRSLVSSVDSDVFKLSAHPSQTVKYSNIRILFKLELLLSFHGSHAKPVTSAPDFSVKLDALTLMDSWMDCLAGALPSRLLPKLMRLWLCLLAGMSLVWLLIGCLNIFSVVWFRKKKFGGPVAYQSEESPQILVSCQISSPSSFWNVSEMCLKTISCTNLSIGSQNCVWYQFEFHKSKEWARKNLFFNNY